MNEDQIAKQVADSLPKEDISPVANPQPDNPEDNKDANSNFVDKITPESYLTKMQIYDYFELKPQERHDPRVEAAVNGIMEWAATEAQSKDIYAILAKISERELQLGSKLNGRRVYKLDEYVKIHKLRQQIDAREKLLNG